MLKYEVIKKYLFDELTRSESVRRLPTVRELMRKFNVSMATVNRALQELEHENVIIRKPGSGIVPARNSTPMPPVLKEKKAQTVILAVTDYPSELIWKLAYSIDQTMRLNDFNVILCKIYRETSGEDLKHLAELYPDCSGLMIQSPPGFFPDEMMEILKTFPFPVLFLDGLYYYENLEPNIYMLSPDPVSAVELITGTLLKNGHTRIGYLRNEPLSSYSEQFVKLLGKKLRKAGVEFGNGNIFSETVRSGDDSAEAAQKILRNNLDKIRAMKLTALIFTSTEGAFAAIPVLREAGFNVPEDISLISENDPRNGRYSCPALTVTAFNSEEMTKRAIEILRGNFRDEHMWYAKRILIERQSVTNLNKGDKK